MLDKPKPESAFDIRRARRGTDTTSSTSGGSSSGGTGGTTPVVPTSQQDPTYVALLKSIMPWLSPEDAQAVAATYGWTIPGVPGQGTGGAEPREEFPAWESPITPPTEYAGTPVVGTQPPSGTPAPSPSIPFYTGYMPIPGTITAELRNTFLGQQRAQDALTALTNAATAAKVPLTNAGYNFLKQSIGLLGQFGGAGGTEGMSSQAYNQLSTAFSGLVQQATSDAQGLDPYVQLASMFLNPTFSAGSLRAVTKSGAPVASDQLFN